MHEPVGWVYTVAVNRGRRDLRREGRRVPAPAPTGAPNSPDASATFLMLDAALARLAPRQRTAVVLRYLVDLPVNAIADAMSCSIGTVKATIHAGLRNLQVTLDEPEEADAY